MSIVAPNQRRVVWPVAIALTCSMLVALFLYLPTRTPTVEVTDSVAAPGVAQAEWEVKIFPAGVAGVGKLSKKNKARIEAQRAPVTALVQQVYDALFLKPDSARDVLGRHFVRAAAARAVSAEIGAPKGVAEVQLTHRTARIGIHAAGARRAAAKVVIAGRARAKGREGRFRHKATLWLERSDRTWKVIAYDVTQGPTK